MPLRIASAPSAEARIPILMRVMSPGSVVSSLDPHRPLDPLDEFDRRLEQLRLAREQKKSGEEEEEEEWVGSLDEEEAEDFVL